MTLVLKEIYWWHFFIWTESEESLEKFLGDVNKYTFPEFICRHDMSHENEAILSKL